MSGNASEVCNARKYKISCTQSSQSSRKTCTQAHAVRPSFHKSRGVNKRAHRPYRAHIKSQTCYRGTWTCPRPPWTPDTATHSPQRPARPPCITDTKITVICIRGTPTCPQLSWPADTTTQSPHRPARPSRTTDTYITITRNTNTANYASQHCLRAPVRKY